MNRQCGCCLSSNNLVELTAEFVRLINSCFSIEIAASYSFCNTSNFICVLCVEKIKEISAFRNQILVSQTKLREFYFSTLKQYECQFEPNEPVVKSEILIKEESLSDCDTDHLFEKNKFSKENLTAVINHANESKEPIQEKKLFDYNAGHSNHSSIDINNMLSQSMSVQTNQNFESNLKENTSIPNLDQPMKQIWTKSLMPTAPKGISKPKEKLKRQCISLQKKLQILDLLKCGEKHHKISEALNISESTIRTIKKCEDKIRERVSVGSLASIDQTRRVKNNLLAKTEKCLMVWIDDRRQKNIFMSGCQIKTKALKLFAYLKEKESDTKTKFLASKGWLERFKNRFSLKKKMLHGESVAPNEADANNFLVQFQNIVQERGYSPDQVFNAGGMGLNWKTIPERSYISKLEKSSDDKSSKDRITLLLCSNASGDCIMKPMIVNRSLKGHEMDGLNLPVYYRTNKNARVTQNIFRDWFFNCFVPEVENYTKNKNIPFKILLLIDNVPGCPTDLYHPNVNVFYPPPNTSFLIQPLECGIIKAFKSYYIRHMFQSMVDKVNSNPNVALTELWKSFSILNSIEIIVLAIKELKSFTLNACWKCVWPEVVLNENLEIPFNENYHIMNLARYLGGKGFEDMTESDINEMINDNPELTEDELVQMVEESNINYVGGDEDSIEICFNEPDEGSE